MAFSQAETRQRNSFRRGKTVRVLPLFLWAACLELGLLAVGCKKEEESGLPPARIHAITRELAKAAQTATRHTGSGDPKFEYGDKNGGIPDRITIALSLEASELERRRIMVQLIQALNRVATANHLTRGPVTDLGSAVRFQYKAHGIPTHIIYLSAESSPRTPTPSASNAELRRASESSRLAIILDDLGNDRAAAEAIFSLSYPLTISVLPNHAHSVDIAEEAYRRGYQIMLHLPMQSVGKEQPEIQELRPGMPADQIPLIFSQMLETVPNAVGVNNHQGSQATADPSLMAELMPILRNWNMFYVDSRTTAATVAYDAAQQAGVRSAFRNVPFLDDAPEAPAIRKELELAIRGAREKGAAIAIGHPHPETLKVLREVLPQTEGRGVHLVFASDLVH